MLDDAAVCLVIRPNQMFYVAIYPLNVEIFYCITDIIDQRVAQSEKSGDLQSQPDHPPCIAVIAIHGKLSNSGH